MGQGERAALLAVWVPGRPKTKGSMRVRNAKTGAMSEAVEGSKRWRQLVHYATVAEMARSGDAEVYPLAGSVHVDAWFYLPVDPTGRRAGDLDKLARNLLDALQDAGVYTDDVQVTELGLFKVQAGELGPGVEFWVRQWR
jgi:Holliday junction resolvase RusA-like endonuclease